MVVRSHKETSKLLISQATAPLSRAPTSASETRLSLLLVEDDNTDALLLKTLVGASVELTRVRSLGECRLLLHSGSAFDAILLDLGLPDSFGLETLTQLDEVADRPPIVVLTGSDDQMLGQQAVKAGAQDFLSKAALNADTLARSLLYAVDRHRQSRKVERSLSEVQAVFRATPQALLRTDASGKVTAFNEKAIELFGKAEALLNRTIDELIPSLPCLGKASRGETFATRTDGTHFPAEYSTASLNGVDGSGYVLWVADISERHANQLALLRAHAELRKAAHQAGRYDATSNLMHDIGNALTSVCVSADVLVEQVQQSLSRRTLLIDHAKITPEQEKSQASLLRWLKLYQHLDQAELALAEGFLGEFRTFRERVDHIRTILRAHSTDASAQLEEEVDLVPIVLEAIDMCAGYAKGGAIKLVFEGPSELWLTSQQHKLVQILINLLKNSIEASLETHAREVHVLVSTTGDRRLAEVSVEDHGIGFTEADKLHIFEHGYTTKPDGTGFGLHSAALQAKELRGGLHASSPGPGAGARFTLTLPLTRRGAGQSE